MSEVLKEFLEANLPVAGLAAWGMRLADGTVLARCCNAGLAVPQIEQMVNAIATAGRGLEPHGLQPVRLCWVFEHARLHLALRPEGVSLVLLMENRADHPSGEVERVIETFVQMPRTW
jgi:hypothetical protein